VNGLSRIARARRACGVEQLHECRGRRRMSTALRGLCVAGDQADVQM
jgi:hypothetical protein